MRIDLFELVEGLFRGIVYFIYNLIGTTGAVIRHPIIGPFRLHRQHSRPHTRQIGGLTYLFLLFLIFYWFTEGGVDATNGLPGLGEMTDRMASASVSAPSLNPDAIWPLIVASLLSTVLFDAVLRLLLRWRLRGRQAYRQLLLSAAEYAMLWMVLALASAMLALAMFVRDILFGPDWAGYALVGWAVVSFFVSAYPAARILGRAARRRRYRRGSIVTGMRMFGLAMLFGLAIFVAATVSADIQDRRDERDYKATTPSLRTLSCTTEADGRIAVSALLALERGDPQGIESDQLNLQLENGDGSIRMGWALGQKVEWARPDTARFVVVSEDRPVLIELRTADAAVPPAGALCRLSGRSIRLDGLAVQFK